MSDKIVYIACIAALAAIALAGCFYGPTGVGVTVLFLLTSLAAWFVGWVVKQTQEGDGE